VVALAEVGSAPDVGQHPLGAGAGEGDKEQVDPNHGHPPTHGHTPSQEQQGQAPVTRPWLDQSA